jgi:hypothetical protein
VNSWNPLYLRAIMEVRGAHLASRHLTQGKERDHGKDSM